MRSGGVVLFVIGVVVAGVGFGLSHFESLPFLARSVAGEYTEAMEGIETLRRGESVGENDIGFQGIRDAYRRLGASKSDWRIPPGAIIVRFSSLSRNVGAFLGETRLSAEVPLRAHLSNGRWLPGELAPLKSDLETRIRARLFATSAVVFGLGILLEVLGFRAGRGETRGVAA